MKTLLPAALLVAATSVRGERRRTGRVDAIATRSLRRCWTFAILGGNAGALLDPDCDNCTDTKFQEGFCAVGFTAGYNWQFGHTVLGVREQLRQLR